jgi:hypothetical protein
MSPEEFKRSAQDPKAARPALLSPPLLALWHDARGDWDLAHECVQEEGSREGAWVHAYLHRKEGDLGNAGYWYARAGRPRTTLLLEEEWSAIAGELLGRLESPHARQ